MMDSSMFDGVGKAAAVFLVLLLLVAVGFGVFLHSIGTMAWNDDRYRQGQIDALQGKQHYHLVEHPDGTRTYERKDDDQ